MNKTKRPAAAKSKALTKKTAAKKASIKKAAPKKAAVKKVSAKKTIIKKSVSKKAVAKKVMAKGPLSKSTKKPAGKKLTATKSVSKKTAPQKNAPKTKSSSAKKPNAPEKIIAQVITKSLEDIKGKDITELDVRKLTDVTEILIIVSGTSNRHVKSLAENAMVDIKKAGYKVYGSEGQDAGEWVLVDFGGVVLHVMQPHIREFYDLEKLWSAPSPRSE